jgi:hypothetical protein
VQLNVIGVNILLYNIFCELSTNIIAATDLLLDQLETDSTILMCPILPPGKSMSEKKRELSLGIFEFNLMVEERESLQTPIKKRKEEQLFLNGI